MDRLAIGRIRSSHGVKGHLKVRSFSGEFNHFKNLKVIDLNQTGEARRFLVEAVVVRSSDILLKLGGIENPEDAKSLAGSTIWVDRRFAAPLRHDEYYAADLKGCHVYHLKRAIGRVASVYEAGGMDLIEIQRHDGSIFVLPFTNHFVGDVVIDEKKLNSERMVRFIDIHCVDFIPGNVSRISRSVHTREIHR